MTSVVIWRYIENKINLTFKGGGVPPNIMAGAAVKCHKHRCHSFYDLTSRLGIMGRVPNSSCLN